MCVCVCACARACVCARACMCVRVRERPVPVYRAGATRIGALGITAAYRQSYSGLVCSDLQMSDGSRCTFLRMCR